MEYQIMKERISAVAEATWITLEQRVAGLAMQRRFHNAQVKVAEWMLGSMLLSYCKAAYSERAEDYLRNPDYLKTYEAAACFIEACAMQGNSAEHAEKAKALKDSVYKVKIHLAEIQKNRAAKYEE